MHGSGNDGSPNLTPLLDLVLQLIMFLMITANFVRAESFSDEITLPVVQQARPLERKADYFVFLNLDKDGKLINIPGLTHLDSAGEARLKAYLQEQKLSLERIAADKGVSNINVTVVLRADEDTRYGDEYRILDACSRAGYYSWQLRVKTVPPKR